MAEVTALTVVRDVTCLVRWSSDCTTLTFWSDVVLMKITRHNRAIAEIATHTILFSFVLSNVVYKEPLSA